MLLNLLKSKNKASGKNEDGLFVSESEGVIRFGVADGAGGHPRGGDAAYEVLDEIRKVTADSLFAQIERANERVLELKVGAKTTLAFAHIDQERISFHTVGDSEIVYWNAVGRELYSSTPHSPTGLKVEAGVTSQEDALSDPERHIVNSLMGDEFVKINSTTNIKLKKGHTVLLGTDGIFDNISHQELGESMALGSFEESFEQISCICISQCEKRWLKEDDIAFIYLRKIKSK